MGLDFQGRRIAEGTQEVQEILKAQAAILHVRGGEDVTYPLPEGVRLWQPTKTHNIVTIYIKYTEVTIHTAESRRIRTYFAERKSTLFSVLHCDCSTDVRPYLNDLQRVHGAGALRSAVLNSSPRAPPLCIFRMLLLSLQMFVLFERKCPAKWTSQDVTRFRHDSSSKRTNIFHSKCIEVCETWIKIVYIYRGIWCHTRPCVKTLRSAYPWMNVLK